jgi:hypothetical protein
MEREYIPCESVLMRTAMEAEDALSPGRDFSFALSYSTQWRKPTAAALPGEASFGTCQGNQVRANPTAHAQTPHTANPHPSKVTQRPASQPATIARLDTTTEPDPLRSNLQQNNTQWVVFTPTERVSRLRPSPTRALPRAGTFFSRPPRDARMTERGEEVDAFVDVAGSRPPASRSSRRSAVSRARARLPRRSALSCATRTESPRSRPSPVRLCHRGGISRELTVVEQETRSSAS